MEERVERRAVRAGERANLAVLVPVRGAHLGDEARRRPSPARCGRRAQLARVERRAEPFFGCLHLEKVVEPNPEALELGREKAGQRIAERSARSPAPATDCQQAEQQAATAAMTTVTTSIARHRSLRTAIRGFTRMVPRMNPWPAPQTCEHSNV